MSVANNEFDPDSDLIEIPPLSDRQWRKLQFQNELAVLRHYLSFRNLWRHRGNFLRASFGFAWGGIYRNFLVSSIVATSYNNEGHHRPLARVHGTGRFFSSAFRVRDHQWQEIVDEVNLRHFLTGVVERDKAQVTVPGKYVEDFLYVSTAVIESLRRGFEAQGIKRNSARGQRLAWLLCKLWYPVGAWMGVTHMPKDLEAHERFRAHVDRRLETQRVSARIHGMAKEMARNVFPITAALSGVTLAEHRDQHLDPITARFLELDDLTLAAMQPAYEEFLRDQREKAPRFSHKLAKMVRSGLEAKGLLRCQVRTKSAHIRELWEAYNSADPLEWDCKVIGAILLFAIDNPHVEFSIQRRELQPCERLIGEGHQLDEMYVVLEATATLYVVKAVAGLPDGEILGEVVPPVVLGEIGMWKDTPTTASIVAGESPVRLKLIAITRRQFSSLRAMPAFRRVVAAEVQGRLRRDAAVVAELLTRLDSKQDGELDEIMRLVEYISADYESMQPAIHDLPEDALPEECVGALQRLANDYLTAHRDLPQEIRQFLCRFF